MAKLVRLWLSADQREPGPGFSISLGWKELELAASAPRPGQEEGAAAG